MVAGENIVYHQSSQIFLSYKFTERKGFNGNENYVNIFGVN